MVLGSSVYKLDTRESQVLALTAGVSVVSIKAIRAYAVMLLATVDCHIAINPESDVVLEATEDDFLLMAGQYLPIACIAGGSIAALPATVAMLDPTWRVAVGTAVGDGQLYVTPIIAGI